MLKEDLSFWDVGSSHAHTRVSHDVSMVTVFELIAGVFRCADPEAKAKKLPLS